MLKGKLKNITSYLERRGAKIYEFNKVCKVIYISKSINNFGDRISGAIGNDCWVVIGLLSDGVMYRGMVKSDVLNVFSVNNPQPGSKYRVQSKSKPEKGTGAEEILHIENIVPARNLYFLFF